MMPHTKILDEYPDIVTICHCQGVEITAQHIHENISLIQQIYPHKRLLLIDHQHSYSFSFDAIMALKQFTYFYRIAVVVYNQRMLEHEKQSIMWLMCQVPFDVFLDRDEATRFLRKA